MNNLIALSGLGLLTLFSEIFRFKHLIRPLVLAGLLVAVGASVGDWNTTASYFNDMLVVDRYSAAFGVLLTGLTTIWYALFPGYFNDEQNRVDRSALVVFALIGALCMVSFNNMIMLFLGIEILSVSLYVLAGSEKLRLDSNEAALKYFLMGAFATGFLLFGIALTYGATGSFDVQVIGQAISESPSGHSMMLIAGLFLLLVAMVFKVSAAPLHFWAPDVYQGAPTPITAFMSTVVKTAAFAAFFRLFSGAFGSLTDTWSQTLSVIAGATILVGNVAAVAQTNLKRMLAYSSVAHAGYLTMAIVAMNGDSTSALYFYVVAYCLSSLSAFCILLIVNNSTSSETIDGFRGLAQKNPLLAGLSVVSMLSLAGIPPTAGFFAKYFIFTAALQSGHLYLVLVAVAGSLVGVYYYFRPLMALFSSADDQPVRMNGTVSFLLVVLALATLFFGLAPGWLTAVFS